MPVTESKVISNGNYSEFPTAFQITREWLQANCLNFIFSRTFLTNSGAGTRVAGDGDRAKIELGRTMVAC